MIWTVAVNQLFLGKVSFTALAVQPGIFIKIDIPAVVYFLQNFLDHGDMGDIRCSDEMVRFDIKERPGRSETER